MKKVFVVALLVVIVLLLGTGLLTAYNNWVFMQSWKGSVSPVCIALWERADSYCSQFDIAQCEDNAYYEEDIMTGYPIDCVWYERRNQEDGCGAMPFCR